MSAVARSTYTKPLSWPPRSNAPSVAGYQAVTVAEAVFDLWCYGQSAYVPSVAEMRLLYAARKTVNPVLELCGGDTLPADNNSDCWYWTSTEVEGQQTAKAWLYSIGSGAMQETPKTQAHRVRPIITINN